MAAVVAQLFRQAVGLGVEVIHLRCLRRWSCGLCVRSGQAIGGPIVRRPHVEPVAPARVGRGHAGLLALCIV